MTHTQNREGNVYARCELRFRQVDKQTKAFQKERAVRAKALRQEKMNYVGGVDNELWQEWWCQRGRKSPDRMHERFPPNLKGFRIISKLTWRFTLLLNRKPVYYTSNMTPFTHSVMQQSAERSCVCIRCQRYNKVRVWSFDLKKMTV